MGLFINVVATIRLVELITPHMGAHELQAIRE